LYQISDIYIYEASYLLQGEKHLDSLDNKEKSPHYGMFKTLRDDGTVFKGSYYVSSGCADLYVARRAVNIGSVIEEQPLFLCSFSSGREIPSLYYRDKGHVNWYFIIKYDTDTSDVEEHEQILDAKNKERFVLSTPAAPFYYDESTEAENRFCASFVSWYQEEQLRDPNIESEQENPELVVLDGHNELYTHSDNEKFYVKSGNVNVFVGRSYSGERERLFFFIALKEGDTLPGVGDRDKSGYRYYFKLAAADKSATVVRKPGRVSSADQIAFLALAGIKDKNYNYYSYKDSIIDWYNTKCIKIIINPHETDITANPVGAVSLQPFYEQGSLPLFKAVSYACWKSRIAHVSEEELCRRISADDLTVEKIADISHFICRRVVLENDWWKHDCGPIISKIGDAPVACVAAENGKYHIYRGDCTDGSTEDEILTPETARSINPSAYSIGRTLPAKKLEKKELFNFCCTGINRIELAVLALLCLFSVSLGLLLPALNKVIYDSCIPIENCSYVGQVCIVVLSFIFGKFFFNIAKNISEYRISTRIGYELQSALIYRSFYLPEKFFRDHESTDIVRRILSTNRVVAAYTDFFITSFLVLLFAIIYIIVMLGYSARLSGAAVLMLLLFALVLCILYLFGGRDEAKISQADSTAETRLYQYLCAIDKIRMAGAEKSAVQKYLAALKEFETEKDRKSRFVSAGTAIQTACVGVITIVLCCITINERLNLAVGSFIAFNTAFGLFASAVLSEVDRIVDICKAGPDLARIMPLITCEPEYATDNGNNKLVQEALHGNIKINNLSFSYGAGAPMVLKGLNMEIKEGDYVGIVGPSGCGKSTLFKLLLGFETPKGGEILIDGKNLSEIDKGSYRRNLGVVLQNGKLINGSIQENITVTAPNARLSDVRNVIKTVGLEQDIKDMPMGIHTMVSENSDNISGGQRQRILIARAIICNPKLLLFDEATSALDNITQNVICDALENISATKLVIAHRLSTVRRCSKIFVMDNGKIIESGTYEELMKAKGFFAEMAARQLADGENEL
jgi:NHLM bacteriocin system ABC transporter ATP-binding protein